MHEKIRKLIFPFEKIEKIIPLKGKILDLGCGHGIFSFLLAKNRNRQILAIDPDGRKILLAQKKNYYRNLRFAKKKIFEIKNHFDVICVIDVFYLMSNKEMKNSLYRCYQLLKPKGLLVVSLTNEKGSIARLIMLLEEIIMVKILKLTHSNQNQINFIGKEEYIKLAQKTNFRLKEELMIKSLFFYQHQILVFQKNKKFFVQ